MLLSGLLLACAAVIIAPWASRLLLDPADPATRSWRLLLPVAGAVGMLALPLPRGGIALGLGLFYLLWTGYLAAGALAQAARSGGTPAWANAGSALLLVAGAGVLAAERGGWQSERAHWLLLGAALAHVVVAATASAIAWDRMAPDGARSLLLAGFPLAGALLLTGWVWPSTALAVVAALLLLGCALPTLQGAMRSDGEGGQAPAGRSRVRAGSVVAAVGLAALVAGALPVTWGFGLSLAGLALSGGALTVAVSGWSLLLAPVSTACAQPQPATD